jgi:hypothetical protein
MKKIPVLILTLFLPLIASGDMYGKSNSFSMEKDVSTGIWTYVCTIKIQGIDRQGIYNGLLTFRSDFDAIDLSFVLGPSDRTYYESSSGVYEFEAKVTGKTFAIQMVYLVSQPSWTSCAVALGTGDVIIGNGDLWGGSMELRYSGN